MIMQLNEDKLIICSLCQELTDIFAAAVITSTIDQTIVVCNITTWTHMLINNWLKQNSF